MFHILVDQSAKLVDVLNELVDETGIIEMKEIMARFTTDVISSTAIGLEANSLRNPDAVFRKIGKKIVEPSLCTAVKRFFFFNRKLANILNVSAISFKVVYIF